MARQFSLEQRPKIAAWQEDFQSLIPVQRKLKKVCGLHTATMRRTSYSVSSGFLKTSSVPD